MTTIQRKASHAVSRSQFAAIRMRCKFTFLPDFERSMLNNGVAQHSSLEISFPLRGAIIINLNCINNSRVSVDVTVINKFLVDRRLGSISLIPFGYITSLYSAIDIS